MDLLKQVKDSGRLKGIAADVFEILYNTSGLTGGEIWRRYKAKNPKTKLSRNDTQKRVNDLVNWGAVQATGTKAVCAVTGKTVMTWKLTGKVPTKAPVPRETPAVRAQRVEKFIETMRKERLRDGNKAAVLNQVRESINNSTSSIMELNRMFENADKWYTGTARARRQRKDALEYALNTLNYILKAETEPK